MAAGGGGHEPNLTPFVDLFSVLICFLLMTAAWIQLESVDITIGPITSKDPHQVETPPPQNLEKPDMKVHVELSAERLHVRQNKIDRVFQRQNWPTDLKTLENFLTGLRQRTEGNEDVIIKSIDGVTYGELIETYDVVISSGWSSVAISPY